MKETECCKLSEKSCLLLSLLFIKFLNSSDVYLSLRGRRKQNSNNVMVTGLIIHEILGIKSKDSVESKSNDLS